MTLILRREFGEMAPPLQDQGQWQASLIEYTRRIDRETMHAPANRGGAARG